MSKTTLPKADLSLIIPEVPAYIYECMNMPDTPEAEKELQEKATVEALLTATEPTPLTELIPFWDENTALLSKFESRSPTQAEWLKLASIHPTHKDMPALIRKYESTFTLYRSLNRETAPLLANITDWNDWIKRNPLDLNEYLYQLDSFNSLDVHPELQVYKKAYQYDLSALQDVLKSIVTKTREAFSTYTPDWLFNNPYATTQTEKDKWLIFLSNYPELESEELHEQLKELYKRGALPRENLTPGIFLSSNYLSDEDQKDCLRLVHKDVSFRNAVIAFCFGCKKGRSRSNLECYESCVDIMLDIIEHGWLTSDQVVQLMRPLSVSYYQQFWKLAEKHYSTVLTQHWKILADSDFNSFCRSVPATRIVTLNLPVTLLLQAYMYTKDLILLDALKSKSKDLEPQLSTLNTQELTFVLREKLCLVPYSILETHTNRMTGSYDRLSLVKKWLGTVKPHMKLKDYQALVLYLVRQDTGLKALISEKRYKVLKKVLNVVI
jgi:hypothetical protein